MKRRSTLLIILCIGLIIPGIIIGARDKPFHLFWNMPFGMKIDSCLTRLSSENAYEFIEVPDEEDENINALLSSRKTDVYYMGYPVDVAFIFSSGVYNEACVVFRHDEAYIDKIQSPEGVSEESPDQHLQKTIDTYFDLLQKMNVQYHSAGEQFLIALDENDERILPLSGTESDAAEITKLLQSLKTASLSVAYDNISLSVDKSIMGENQTPIYTVYMSYEGDA